MRRLIYSLLLTFSFIPFILYSQTVTGKLVDHNGNALSGLQLKLYIFPNIYDATSGSDGSFVFNSIVSIKREEQLPSGYAVSESYPNPFNPKTRIGFMLPNSGSVKVTVFNTLGQKVIDEIEKQATSGIGSVDMELNGLPNGLYLARIILDGKYVVTKKLMLMYGSTHLSATAGIPNFQLNKSAYVNNTSALVTNIDSLVVTSTIIGKKTFRNLPVITGNLHSLGNLTIDRFCIGIPTIIYEGKTYNSVQLGAQCWLKENLDVGIMILSNQNASDNGIIEKYCFNNDPNNCNIYGGLYKWNEAMAYSNILDLPPKK